MSQQNQSNEMSHKTSDVMSQQNQSDVMSQQNRNESTKLN